MTAPRAQPRPVRPGGAPWIGFTVWQREHRRERASHLRALLGGRCKRANDRCEGHLELHHRDPSTKSFDLLMNLNRRWDALVSEAQKCDLLCTRHHIEADSEIGARGKGGRTIRTCPPCQRTFRGVSYFSHLRGRAHHRFMSQTAAD